MSKGDQIEVTLVGLKNIEAIEQPLFGQFAWTATLYKTESVGSSSEGGLEWGEQFKIWCHPIQDKIVRFEVRQADGSPFGKVLIDLGHLKPGLSDAWYPLSRLEHCKASTGHLRVRLNKIIHQEMPAFAMSAILPTLEQSAADQAEEEYVANLTKEEREAFYDQDKLRKVVREEENAFSDHGQEVDMPTGAKVAKFWELKNMFPGLDDRKIYLAMARFNPFDIDQCIEYIQQQMNQQARKIGEKLLIDGGALAAAPQVDELQVKKNFDFMKNANAGQMMDVVVEPNPLAGVADTGRRKALLIGCDYQKLGPSWNQQGGPLKDIRRVRNWLENVWGFANEEGRMMMMADDHPQNPCRPTKGNILRALEWLGRDAVPGDSLFVFFSGLGGTMEPDNESSAFEGPRPFWYGIDSKKVDIADIYHQFLFKLPEACRVTFIVDCPNWHLWQPFYYCPESVALRNTSHPYFLPADIQVFTSIGHPIDAKGGRFTNALICLTSGSNFGKTKYELLAELNRTLKEPTNLPKRVQALTGTRYNYYTCSQKTDLNVPFDLNTWAPNCNLQIGPGPLNLSAKAAAPAPDQDASMKFKLNITGGKATDTAAAAGGSGLLAPPKPSATARRVSMRDELRSLKKEYKDHKESKKNKESV